MNQVFLDLNPHVFEADLVAQLVEQARVTGLQMTGDGGLPLQLTKRIMETALEAEITDHLAMTSATRQG